MTFFKLIHIIKAILIYPFAYIFAFMFALCIALMDGVDEGIYVWRQIT